MADVVGNLAQDMINRHIQNKGTFSLIAQRKDGRVYWKAFAEMVVKGGFKQWKTEGFELDKVIRNCVGQAPANPEPKSQKRKVVRRRN